MANNLKTLNDALFRELERLESCESEEELERECARAKAVSSLAGNIIANGKTAIEAAKVGMSTAAQVEVRNMLLDAPREADDETA